MNSSQNSRANTLFAVYKDPRTVFKLIDIALITGENDFELLNKKLNYYVRTGRLENPRKGIYSKQNYSVTELACKVFTPSYISLEFVLQRAGVVFQFDSGITSVSYLSRNIRVDSQNFSYRKIKGGILLNGKGIIREANHVNIAQPERAFLDLFYLNPHFHFDNLNPLDKVKVYDFMSIYDSKALSKRVNKLLKK